MKKSLRMKQACVPIHSRYEHALIMAITVISIVFVLTLLQQCHRGIDLTDEGFYINWISNPWLYKNSVTQFGYIYHPLYQMLGENLVLLRQADMLIMLGLAWVLCVQLLRYTLPYDELKRIRVTPCSYAIAFGLATSVFTFFGAIWWLPTPSYNSLALEAALIISIALLQVSQQSWRHSSDVILGLGYWLAFMAKPTAAVLLGGFSFLYLLLIAGKQFKITHYLLTCSIAIALICLSAWIIDGSIIKFFERLHIALDVRTLVSGGRTLSGLMPMYGWLPNEPKRSVLFLLITTTFLIISSSTKKHATAQYLCLYVALFIEFLVIKNLYIVPLDRLESLAQGLLTQALTLTVPFGALLSCLVMFNQQRCIKKTLVTTHYDPIYLSIFFVLLPFLCTYGTLMDLWTNSLRLGFFFLLAIFPLIALIKQKFIVRWRIVLCLVVYSQLITITLVQQATEHPFHQRQPLRLQNQSIDILHTNGKKTTPLIVSDHDVRYISELKRAAFSHGFSSGDPIIDLSDSPTSLYILGAKAIGASWIETALASQTADLLYDYLQTILVTIPCDELSNAWVLAPTNYYITDVFHVLKLAGIDRISLEPIEDIIHQEDTYHGFVRQQQLWKPIGVQQDAIFRCEKNRKKQIAAQNSIRNIVQGQRPTTHDIIGQSITYLNDNKAHLAIALLKQATILNSTNADLYNNLCVAYGMEKQYTNAISACTNALRIAPDFQLAKNNLAWVEHEKRTS